MFYKKQIRKWRTVYRLGYLRNILIASFLTTLYLIFVYYLPGKSIFNIKETFIIGPITGALLGFFLWKNYLKKRKEKSKILNNINYKLKKSKIKVAIIVFLLFLLLYGCLVFYNFILLVDNNNFGLLAGRYFAEHDFYEENLRFLELTTTGNYSYSGVKKGQFEIWFWPNRNLLKINRQANKNFIEAYNRGMQRLYKNKNNNIINTNKIHKENQL